MCGDEAAAARSMLQITYPVRIRIGDIVSHALMRLGVDGEWSREEVG